MTTTAPAADADLEAFIRALPKTETHLHLEGALPFELLHGVAPERFPRPPASWDPGFRFPDFATFESGLIVMATAWFTTPERYHEAAGLVFRRLVHDQNVRYVETSVASGLLEVMRLDGPAVVEAVLSAAPAGLEVRVFLGIHHQGYHEGTAAWIDGAFAWPGLAGLDLHGPETDPLGPWAARLWSAARAAGLTTKAHAGEFDGPDFVRRVVEELGVRRVQHGVRAVEDPELVRELAERGVTFDVCPISNEKLAVVPSLEAHPIRTLMDAGIRCTVSTDDPLVFGNTLFDEYRALATRLGFSRRDLADVAANGFRNALADADWVSDRLGEIDAVLSGR